MAKPAELFTDSLAEEIGRLGQNRRTTPVKLYVGIESFSLGLPDSERATLGGGI
jgi:hypothetical protein